MKKNIKKTNSKKTTITMIIVIGIVVLLFTVGTIICAYCYKEKPASTNNEKYLRTYIAKFYEEDYFVSTDIEDIKGFKETGVTVNLESLERLVDKKFDINCNLEKSTITIYPKEPFSKKDYRVEFNLECDK